MQKKSLYRIILVILAVYLGFVVSTYFIAGDRLNMTNVQTDEMVAPSADVGEILPGTVIRQPISFRGDRINTISLFLANYGRENTSSVLIRIENETEVLSEIRISASEVEMGKQLVCYLPTPCEVSPNEQLWLVVASDDATPGNAVSAYYGTSVALSKGELEKSFAANQLLQVNGVAQEGVLCYQVSGIEDLQFGQYYWYFALAGFAILAVYFYHLVRCYQKNKKSWGLNLCVAFSKYLFLMQQLVARDFKAKYKRSILGILWSFLNPLLTLAVQYIVFSTIFKSSIENYALYLLIGIVCFNFFSEATGMCLNSILGNAQLITKVYIPKYIFPITRTISSSINLLFSLIPIVLVIIVMQVQITWSFLLVIFALFCLLLFCMGIGMALSAIMVFFRDVQFLWSVFTMIIFYATPILYPEQLLSGAWQLLFKVNPLYHIIRFIRISILEGISPEPQAYLMCFLGAVLSFVVGTLIFKKTQDQFALNL